MPESTTATGRHGRFTPWLSVGALALTVAVYLIFLSQYSMNVPLADDIYDILQVLIDVHHSNTAADTLAVLFQQHNDHRTLASRLLYLGLLQLTGEVDFRLLTLIANLGQLGLLVALYLMARPLPNPALVMLGAALLTLHLRAYGITLWSMAAFAYFYVFLYGFYAIMLLHKASPLRLSGAIILATLSSFTLASGQAIWLIGLLCLLQQCAVRRSLSLLYPLIWLLAAWIVLSLWRIDLQTPNTLGAMLQNFFQAPGHHVLYTLTLLGSVFSESSVALAASAGFAMLMLLLVSSIRNLRSDDIRLELCGWFILLSVAAMVLGRSFTSVEYGLSSRYSFPSILMLATSWVLLAARLRIQSSAVLAAVALASAGFWINSYQLHGAALRPHLEKRLVHFNRGNYPAWPHPMRENNAVIAEAERLGFYQPPQRPLQLHGSFPGLGTIKTPAKQETKNK